MLWQQLFFFLFKHNQVARGYSVFRHVSCMMHNNKRILTKHITHPRHIAEKKTRL